MRHRRSIMLPLLRRKLKGATLRNLAFQDILKTANLASKVIKVEPLTSVVHNTKLTLQLINGEQRVHFYNRLPLEAVISDLTLTPGTLEEILTELNLQGCDFTEDDLSYEGGLLSCKPFSLGYIGQYSLGEDVDPDPVEDITITCEGALAICQPVYGEGVFELVIDGVVIQTGTIDELKVPAREHGVEIVPTIKFATQ